MSESQITGSASSYARKYALNGLFAIDDTKDDDSKKPKDTAPVAEPIVETSKQRADKAIAWVKTFTDLAGLEVAYTGATDKVNSFDKSDQIRTKEAYDKAVKELTNETH